MERKASLPLAPNFLVSAPSKAIVFGEHAAVSLRSYLLVSTLSKSHRTARLNLRDIRLDHTWDLAALPWAAFLHHNPYAAPAALDPALLTAVRPHAEALSPHLPEQERQMHVKSATAFPYLFLALGVPASPGVVHTLRSTIPVGAGLGSSASVCVCLARPHPHQPADEARLQVPRVSAWAFVGELCIHGEPSGVDNTVSAGGHAVVFRGGAGEATVTPLPNFPKLPLLLVDTKQSRSTAKQVDLVRALKREQPEVTETILAGIGQLTESALALLSSPDFDSAEGEDAAIEKVGTLFRANHGLLVALGVSHPRLERVRGLVDHAGVGWANRAVPSQDGGRGRWRGWRMRSRRRASACTGPSWGARGVGVL